jgi:hypothetical protein
MQSAPRAAGQIAVARALEAAVSSSADICSATGRVGEASRSIEAQAEEARWALEAFFAKFAS